MKKAYVLLFMTLLLQSLHAQTITHEVISSLGGYYSNATTTLTFSEGVVIDAFVFDAPTPLKDTRSLTVPTIFPNPATDEINILTPQHSIIDLLDVSGKIIRTIHSNAERTLINVSDCSNGLYLVRVRSENGVWVEKFLKK
jgi:hypothetical protein